jgi:hypothetical protein
MGNLKFHTLMLLWTSSWCTERKENNKNKNKKKNNNNNNKKRSKTNKSPNVVSLIKLYITNTISMVNMMNVFCKSFIVTVDSVYLLPANNENRNQILVLHFLSFQIPQQDHLPMNRLHE